MYHGILVNKSFKDEKFSEQFKVFGQKIDGNWIIFGIEVESSDLHSVIKQIQSEFKDDQNWYAHLYNNEDLIIVFKEKVFTVTSHSSTWTPIIEYGKSKGIPEEQLDFWPNRFQDEQHYFT